MEKRWVPFIDPLPADLNTFNRHLSKAIEVRQYSNSGPCVKELNDALSGLTNARVVLAANATLILEGLHAILLDKGLRPLLPKWTFPATNLAVEETRRRFGNTHVEGNLLGFTTYTGETQQDYAVTTAPFGTFPPAGIQRPNVAYWIIDNAAGATPDMGNVKEWLKRGADAVVVSLHATKGLSAAEGGFVAFRDGSLYKDYLEFINFGFRSIDSVRRTLSGIGSNHKMSELSAAWCLAKLETYSKEHAIRAEMASRYEQFCLSSGIQYIHSCQSFWIRTKDSYKFVVEAKALGLDARPYYANLLPGATLDVNADKLAQQGVCLPTSIWDSQTQHYAIACLERLQGLWGI